MRQGKGRGRLGRRGWGVGLGAGQELRPEQALIVPAMDPWVGGAGGGGMSGPTAWPSGVYTHQGGET